MKLDVIALSLLLMAGILTAKMIDKYGARLMTPPPNLAIAGRKAVQHPDQDTLDILGVKKPLYVHRIQRKDYVMEEITFKSDETVLRIVVVNPGKGPRKVVLEHRTPLYQRTEIEGGAAKERIIVATPTGALDAHFPTMERVESGDYGLTKPATPQLYSHAKYAYDPNNPAVWGGRARKKLHELMLGNVPRSDWKSVEPNKILILGKGHETTATLTLPDRKSVV